MHLNLPRYDRRAVDGLWLGRAQVDEAIARLRAMSYAERAANACIGHERADLVLAGCAILEAIREHFPAERLRIADRGLREGILSNMRRVLMALARTAARASAGDDGGLGPRGRPSAQNSGQDDPQALPASARWLERQLNDPYVAQARREGYRSRAAYKLIEIDDKHKLLKSGQRIVDLGAAPGGWSQVAAPRVGAHEGRGRVIAIDLLEMDPIEGVEFRQMDFHDPEAPARLREWLEGSPMASSKTWRPTPPVTARQTSFGLSAWWSSPPISRAKCWRRVGSSSPRCFRAALRGSYWLVLSATLRPSAT